MLMFSGQLKEVCSFYRKNRFQQLGVKESLRLFDMERANKKSVPRSFLVAQPITDIPLAHIPPALIQKSSDFLFLSPSKNIHLVILSL
jgi:hypothetical protein